MGLMILLLALPMLSASRVQMPWDKWSWASPQSPIEYFFRRDTSDHMPIKSPDFECQCPPNKECVIEFKINDAMGDFLSMRGVLSKEAAKTYQQDVEQVHKYGSNPREYIREKRLRRSNDDVDQCCCPPRTAMMPTFITDTRFDEIVDTLNRKEVPPNMN